VLAIQASPKDVQAYIISLSFARLWRYSSSGWAIDPKNMSGPASVSVKVQKETAYLHSDLEVWT